MSFTPMTDVPNPLFDLNGDPFSGAVLKAYLPGTTTAISIYTDATGSSPQATLTANAQGAWEVTGSEVVPYIDQDHSGEYSPMLPTLLRIRLFIWGRLIM